MAEKKNAIGFGFLPDETKHHFLVVTPKVTATNKNPNVVIYEGFDWDDNDENEMLKGYKPKAEIRIEKWNKIKQALKLEFNNRLKSQNTTVGNWKVGKVPVERMIGKELLLLVWAVEDTDPNVISVAIRNWQGLMPEERWWLFTMTNASTGNVGDKKGWRKAIKYALSENPIEEQNKQASLFDTLLENKLVD